MTVSDDATVTVCGTGLAGLAAALSALEHGARVRILEKGPAPGGTTVLSGGRIWTLKTFEDMVRVAPLADRALQRLVFDRLAGDREWLESHGAVLAPPRRIQLYGESRDCRPRELIDRLLARARELGAQVRFESALDTLVVDDAGVVTGLRVATPEGLVEEATGAVVMATGGFQGNTDLLSRYVVPNADHLLLRSNPWSTGDAFLAATAIGAAVTPGLDNFYGHGILDEPARYGSEDFQAASQYYGPLCVVVNQNGDRFTDESSGISTRDAELNQRLANQPGGKGHYILDARIAEMEVMPDNGVFTHEVIAKAVEFGAAVIVSETIGDLCDRLDAAGVPGHRVRKTLEDYNRAIANDDMKELEPPRARDRHAIEKAPFYAVPVHAGITFTMGGLAVDTEMRVLRRAGTSSPLGRFATGREARRQTPIGGLYAAGGDVGNISHLGYLGGLGPALVTGRIAGAAAARTTGAAAARTTGASAARTAGASAARTAGDHGRNANES